MTDIITAGIDEVGWGALSGPVISVVAVFRPLDINLLPPGVRDSKKTSDAQRRLMYSAICAAAYDVGVGHAWPWEIDQYGPGEALQLSYKRALDEVHPRRRPTLLYVDGVNKVKAWRGMQVVEPKADNKYREVSAASIIAKHFRDTMMACYAKDFPGYNWESNKGYGSPDHIEAIKKYGLLVDGKNHSRYLHRLRYCRKLIRGMQNESCGFPEDAEG